MVGIDVKKFSAYSTKSTSTSKAVHIGVKTIVKTSLRIFDCFLII